MVSFIYIQKLKCVTKEAVDEKYEDESDSDDREDLTIGDDLDSFKMRILAQKFSKNSLGEYGEKKHSFQFSLLTIDEKQKLEQKDSHFIQQFYTPNPDVPEAIMKISESNSKYVESECWRDTFCIEFNEDHKKSVTEQLSYNFIKDSSYRSRSAEHIRIEMDLYRILI